MKKFLLLTCLIVSYNTFAQTTVYSEDFNGLTNWTLNTDPTGEDSNPNIWYISCQEEGVGAGNCGAACGLGDQTLHVGTDPIAGGDLGAAYAETGFAFTTTNRRAESGDINTTGFTSLTLNFDAIGFGGNANDFCELFYSINSGATWTSLAPTLMSTCCDGAGNPSPCTGTEQGLWETKTFVLPAACENIATLRISFVWRNLDDGIATDPSFAADNIEIISAVAAAPVADFSATQTSICENDCIDFTDLSTGSPTSWSWDFGNGQTSTLQNPTNVCYAAAGSYTVTLLVTNASGSDTETMNITVSVCATAPTAGFSASSFTICENDCINFTDQSTDNPTSWFWDFGNGQTSTLQNPTNICYPTAGSYTVTLTATNASGSDMEQRTITVNVCGGPPTATFSVSNNNICENDCINFTDNSTGNPTSWAWDFGNGQTSTLQDPVNICYATEGSYTVTLVATNAQGSSTATSIITVNNCSPPVADFMPEDDSICVGDCISFTDLSLNNPTSWTWTFNGGTPNTSTLENPGLICFDSVGTFSIDLTVTNPYGTNSVSMFIVVDSFPIVTAGNDTTIEMGGTAILGAEGMGGTFNWVPADDLDCTTCDTVMATPLLTTTYFVQLIGPSGCIAQDTVVVNVNFMDIIDVPNTFSPNGDGLNDILYVKGVGITDLTFKIYNRYGELIFTSDSQLEGWDGSFKGQAQNPGTFMYILEYGLVNDTRTTKSGSVTLVK